MIRRHPDGTRLLRRILAGVAAIAMIVTLLVVAAPAARAAGTASVTLPQTPTGLIGSALPTQSTTDGTTVDNIDFTALFLDTWQQTILIDGQPSLQYLTPIAGETIYFSVEGTNGIWYNVCQASTNTDGIAACIGQAPSVILGLGSASPTTYWLPLSGWDAVFVPGLPNDNAGYSAASDYSAFPGAPAAAPSPPDNGGIEVIPYTESSGCPTANPSAYPTMASLLTDGGNCQIIPLEGAITGGVIGLTGAILGGMEAFMVFDEGDLATEGLLSDLINSLVDQSDLELDEQVEISQLATYIDRAINPVFASASEIGGQAIEVDLGNLTDTTNFTVNSGAELGIGANTQLTNMVTIDNLGTISDGSEFGDGTGTIVNNGTIINDGIIVGDGQGDGGVLISGNNYTLNFNTVGAPGAGPVPLNVYAPTVSDSQQSLPTPTAPSGEEFTGWYTAPSGGEAVTDSTNLPSILPAGPTSVVLYAQYQADPATPPPGGPTTTTAASASIPYSEGTGSEQVTLSARTDSTAGSTEGDESGPENEGSVAFQVSNGSNQDLGSSVSAVPGSNSSAAAVYQIPDGTPVGTYPIDATYSDPTGHWASSSDDSQSLTVTSAPTTIQGGSFSFTDPASLNLDAQVSSPAGPVNEGSLTYSVVNSDDQTVASVTSGTLSNGASPIDDWGPGGLNDGSTYTLDVTYNDPSGNFASSSNTGGSGGLLTQSINVSNLPETSPNYVANGGQTFYASSTSGATPTFSVSSASTGVCALDGSYDLILFEGAGECTIDGSVPAYNGYASALWSITIPVVSESDRIYSTTPTSGTYGSTVTVSAGAESGNPVALAVDTSSAGICTLSGDVVTLDAVGTCDIDATVPVTPAWDGASAVIPISVGPAQQSIYFAPQAVTPAVAGVADVLADSTSGAPVALTVDPSTADDCFLGGPAGNQVNYTNVGPCQIDANVSASGDYSAAASSEVLTVGPGPQNIYYSIPPSSPVVGQTYALSAVSDSGAPVSLEVDPSSAAVCSLANGTVSFIGVGDCQIDASVDQQGNYASASSTEILVVQGPQAITFSTPPASPVVGGSAGVSATSLLGDPVSLSIDASTSADCVLQDGTVVFDAIGPCQIDASVSGDYPYQATSTSETIDVAPEAQNIYFSNPPASAVVGDTYAVSATSDSGAPVGLGIDPSSTGVCAIADGTVDFINTGWCQIDASVDASGNYASATSSQSIAVGPPPPPVVTAVSPHSGPISGGTRIVITGSNFVSGDTVTIGGTRSGRATAAIDVSVVSSTKIVATVAAGSKLGEYGVTVTNPQGQSSAVGSNDKFTYTPDPIPVVHKVAPNAGVKAGGTRIVVTGTGFETGDRIVIGETATGGIQATDVTVDSSHKIVAITGKSAMTGTFNLFVLNPVGQASQAVSDDEYTYKRG